jgi:hypothetical protein
MAPEFTNRLTPVWFHLEAGKFARAGSTATQALINSIDRLLPGFIG